MPFPWMAAATALSAGTGLAGSLIGSSQSAKAQSQTNEMNYRIAQEQMAFQREGMQNRHQWEVEDLRKAGLNPILSAGGQPPVPAGATATMHNPKPNRGELALAMSSAVQDLLLKYELRKTEQAKQELTHAQAERTKEGSVGIPGILDIPISRLRDYGRNFLGGATSIGASTAKMIHDKFRKGG